MKTIVAVAGLAVAATASAGHAQGAGAAPPSCYIEVAKLMAEPPVGIAELGTALRELDAALRPQVEHVNQLRAQMARLEQRQAAAGTSLAESEGGIETVGAVRLLPAGEDSTLEEMQQVQAQLNARHAQLKSEYAAQRAAIVGPVQARVGEGATAYAAQQGCRGIKMARAADLPTLSQAGARDLTGGFVAWYQANRPAHPAAAR